jgi:uncharacterized protein
MRFEFDPKKDLANRRAHGYSLAVASECAWDEGFAFRDDRFGYDEMRMVALVPLGERLLYVVFVDRDEVRRIISIRDALRKEVKHYVENYC